MSARESDGRQILPSAVVSISRGPAMKLVAFIKLLAALLLAVHCLSCVTSDGGRVDSGTHWMQICLHDSDCGEWRCICGVCTTSCLETASCLDENSECVMPTGEGRQECAAAYGASNSEGMPDLCLAQCESDADCLELRSDLACHDGLCLPSSDDSNGELVCTRDMCSAYPEPVTFICSVGPPAPPDCSLSFDGTCRWVATNCRDDSCTENSDCNPRFRCTAQDACAADPDCISCPTCVGECVLSEPDCSSDEDCLGDTICNDGWCVGPVCDANDDCESFEQCRDNYCQARPCDALVPCGAREECVEGFCEAMSCELDSECALQDFCDEGFCVPADCVESVDEVCGIDRQTWPNRCRARASHVSVLHEGPCMTACPTTECATQRPEASSACDDGTRAGSFCVSTRGEICDWVTLTCPPPNSCTDDGDCAPGLVCTASLFCLDGPDGADTGECYGWCEDPARICTEDECGDVGEVTPAACEGGGVAEPVCRRNEPLDGCTWRAALCE